MSSAGRGTWFGIEIGRTGLSTAQFGLDSTGHNIANVDTVGYTRQRIVQTAYDPFATIGRFAPVGGGLIGEGTRVKILEQIRSAYLDRRFRTEVTSHTYWDTRSQGLSYVQSFFDNVNEKTSINTSLANFFGSMNSLAADPLSQASRKQMQTTAMDMVQQLNMIYEGLMDLRRSENTAVKTTVQEINRIVMDIADLNEKIYHFEVTGMIANDLRDKRNLLVDQLSEYIDIEYEEYYDPRTQSDRFKINLLCAAGRVNDPAGMPLVDHDRVWELGAFAPPDYVPGDDEPDWEVHWIARYDDTGKPVPGALLDFSKVTGGKLKAHIDLRDGNEFRIDGIAASTDPARITYINMVNGDEYRYNALTGDWTYWDAVNAAFDTSRTITPGSPPVDENGNEMSEINWGEYDIVQTNDSRYRGIPYYIEMLNDLARGLVLEINKIHREGWTDHPTLGSMTGINFFEERNDWVSWVDAAGNVFEWSPAAAFTYTDSAGNLQTGTGGWTFGGGVIAQHPETGVFIDAAGNPITFADANYDYDTPPVTTNPPAGTFYRVLYIANITAENITLDEMIKDNEWNIACSSAFIQRAGGDNPEDTQRHNNENMKKLYTLFGPTNIVFTRTRLDGSSKRIDITGFADFGTLIRFDLGNTLHTAQQTRETSRILQYAAANQRASIADVSLDEEMVGIVRYQHAYNGASRVITAMDEALDRLINGTGRVGL